MERLQGVVRDRRANWEQSLSVLRAAKEAGAGLTKTSIMLGCGETPDEVVAALRTLRENGGWQDGPRVGREEWGRVLGRLHSERVVG